MAESKPPSKLEQWGAGTKTARPESVGPHDRDADQEDPANPGLDPGQSYKPGFGDQAGTAGPGTPGKAPVNIGVKAEGAAAEGGEARDSPPLSGTAGE